MDVSLPGVGLALLATGLSIYYLSSSVRSARETGPTGPGQQPVFDHTYKQSETSLDRASLDIGESTLLPSNESSEQGPDKQVTVSLTAESGKIKRDNFQASNQAPMNANGVFNDAHDFVFYKPITNNVNEAEEKVLQWFTKFTMSGAEFDASDHVPGCHPGTRITILDTLQRWIDGTQHVCRMLWLHGPAGVGKSAILQSLAERLTGASELGATLFFSRPNGRYDPKYVFPTVAYQLAVRIPPYKEYIKQIMINNPKLLEKDMERQFQALIAEPFTKLTSITGGGRWAVLLDGLDECQGENAQALIVKLISRFTRQHPSAPLVWVIASRPEAHLRVVFDSEEVSGSFEEHEVLANSDDACRDVEKICQNYRDLIPANVPWPTERDITRVSGTSSGLFALAATIVQYVGDPDACDPISQLATVLSVTSGLEPGSLSTLYTLYSAILAGVPKTLTSVLKLVLAFHTAIGEASYPDVTDRCYSLVIFATIFGLQQHTVYGALRKLHSVAKVPPLSESGHLGIKFYHASFPDYLGTLEGYTMNVDMLKQCWWGLFAILHGGDLIAYRDAITGGRPPVPLSWDIKLADSLSENLWSTGIHFLLRRLFFLRPLIPGEPMFDRPFLNAKELQTVLERIDFTALIFSEKDITFALVLLNDLLQKFTHTVPLEFSQSGLVRKFYLRDLDLACVPGTHQSSYKVNRLNEEGRVISFKAHMIYNTTLPQHHLSVRGEPAPTEKLVSKLGALQSKHPTMDVLAIGKGPSRQCVLIEDTFTREPQRVFYFAPYCK